MASSQDPDYVPAQYTHDSGVDRSAAMSPLVNSNGPHEYTSINQHNDPFSSGGGAPFLPQHAPEALSATDDALAEQLSYVRVGSPVGNDGRNISPERQRHDTPSSGSRTSSPIKRELSLIREHTPELPETAYNNVNGTTAGASVWSPRLPNHAVSPRVPVFDDTFTDDVGTAIPRTSVEENEEFHQRVRHAECSLTPKQKSKIAKAEAKDNQKLSKFLKEEAKVEKKTLELAISELADLQRFQKQAVKDESKAHADHAKVLAAFKKQETAYLAVKTRYETLLGQLNAEAERLEVVRVGAKEATERVAEKAQEVDSLRKMFSIDEREREARLGQLKERRTSSLWRN